LDAERAIAWRAADSFALRAFLGLVLPDAPPDHSTISRTRRLIDLETHQAVFTWILQRLADADLVKGKTVGIERRTMTQVTAAAVQLSPVLYSREDTIDKVVRTIADLGRRGVQFATFPETVVPYYPYFSFIQPACKIIAGREHLRLLDPAVIVPSDATAAIGDACRNASIVVSIGVNERDGGTLTTRSSCSMRMAR
jgi:hypothetical protein